MLPPNPLARLLLARRLKDGQAVVWYLYHSGVAVKTRRHLLLFDYSNDEPATPGKRSLATGAVEPTELVGQNVLWFISHEHDDHFYNKLEGRKSIGGHRMMQGFFLRLAAVGVWAGCVAAGAAMAINLAPNPSFEHGLALKQQVYDWTPAPEFPDAEYTWDDQEKRTGEHSLPIHASLKVKW